MPTTVRRAVPDDAPALARLRWEFRAERASPADRVDSFLSRCEAWMLKRLAGGSAWRAWIAEWDAHPAGNIWLQVVEKIPNPGAEAECHGYITNFYVRQEYQNGGIGTALLTAAVGDCETLGFDSLFLWPTARSRPLYGRHGFSPASAMLILERRGMPCPHPSGSQAGVGTPGR